MKRHIQSRSISPRRGTLLGVGVIFFSCAMLGGADPVDQIEAAAATKEKVDVAVQEETAAIAQVEAKPVAEVKDDYIDFDAIATKPEAVIQAGSSNGLITVALDDVLLVDAIKIFAQTTGANIIASGTLLEDLRVTANLRDVAWQPALSSILDVHGLSLVEQNIGSGVYSIQAKVPDAPEPTLVETFFLDYTTVGEIQHSITGMLRPNSVLTTFPSRNAVVIRSTDANLREVKVLIESLDRPGRQVLIEAKIMTLSDSAMKELGIRWDSLKEFGVSADLKPFSWSQDSTDTRTTERGSVQSDVITRTQTQTSEQIDASTRVGTERGFLPQDGFEIARPGNTDFIGADGGTTRAAPLGYDPGRESFGYSESTSQSGSSLEDSRVQKDTQGQSVVDDFVRTIAQSQSAILNMSSLSVILSALETMDGVSLVSNPKMVVSSGSTNAAFRVGDREPIIATEIKKGTTDSPGDTITSKLDTSFETEFIKGGYFRTGIDLQVIATVKTDDYIEAFLHPSLSYKTGEKSMGSNSWPVVNIKEILTTVTLRSGQTVAIGGLTDTQDSKKTTRVPVLGRIPIIGRLFSHEENVKSQVETLIFVTLSVADPDELEEGAGIPEDARLIQPRRLKDQASQEEHALKVQELMDAQKAKKNAATNAPAVAEQKVVAEDEATVAVIKESDTVVNQE